jgi:predicted metal-dependent phosphotriesterase family hydrolase
VIAGTDGAAGDTGPFVQTVTGRVPASRLGFTMPHEHTGLEPTTRQTTRAADPGSAFPSR